MMRIYTMYDGKIVTRDQISSDRVTKVLRIGLFLVSSRVLKVHCLMFRGLRLVAWNHTDAVKKQHNRLMIVANLN